MRRWLVRLAVLAALVAAVLILKATVWAPEPVPVEVAPAERGMVAETVTNSRAGTVESPLRARLSPEVGGQVVAIPHREGERVREGDVLLRLDDSTQRGEIALAAAALEAAKARRRQACTAAERAARELTRVRRLAEEGIAAADLLDEVASAREAATEACAAAGAEARRAAAAVELARSALAKTSLRAPFDGVVADLSIEEGEWTTPSPPGLPIPPVIDVLDPSSLHVSAPMDEVDSVRIEPGQPARITVDSLPGQSFAGRVLRVAPYVLDVEEQNRTVEVEVAFSNPGAPTNVLPGTSADVEIVLQRREGVLRIPTQALIEGERVLVLDPEPRADGDRRAGTLVERNVETGLRNWDWTEIRSGLEAGDLVVLSLDRPEVHAGATAVVGAETPAE